MAATTRASSGGRKTRSKLRSTVRALRRDPLLAATAPPGSAAAAPPATGALPAASTGKFRSKRLAALVASRRERHNAALEEFRLVRERIATDIEAEVQALGKDLRTRRAEGLQRLAQRFEEAREPDQLVETTAAQMRELRQWLEAQFQRRKREIESNERQFFQLEDKRAELLDEEMSQLVAQLVEIAHIPSTADVERMLTPETKAANVFRVRNRVAYQELSARLRIADLRELKRRRLEFDEMMLEWRQLRHARELSLARDHLASEEFTDPPQWRTLGDDLQQLHAELEGEVLSLLTDLLDRRLGTTTDPPPLEQPETVAMLIEQLTTEYVTKFRDMRTASDDASVQYIADMRALTETILASQAQYVRELTDRVTKIGALTEAPEIAVAVEEATQALIDSRHASAGTIIDELDTLLQQSDVDFHARTEAVGKWAVALSKALHEMAVELAKLPEDVTEELHERRDAYHEQLCELETRLARAIRGMRCSPDQESLDKLLEEVSELLEHDGLIAQAHRAFARDSSNIVSTHVPRLDALVAKHSTVIAGLFGLEPEQEQAEQADAQPEDEPQPEDSPQPEEPTYVTFSDRRYKQARDPHALSLWIVQGMTDPSPPPTPPADEPSEPSPPASPTSTHEDAPDDSAASTPIPPSSPTPLPSMHPIELSSLTFPIPFVEPRFASLASLFLSHIGTVTASHRAAAKALSHERLTALADELDLALRVHRPRIARVESDFFEVRQVDLKDNELRYARHKQRLVQAVRSGRRQYKKRCEAVAREAEQFQTEASELQAKLADATSLAGINSINKQFKDRAAQVARQVGAHDAGLERMEKDMAQLCGQFQREFLDQAEARRIPDQAIGLRAFHSLGLRKSLYSPEMEDDGGAAAKEAALAAETGAPVQGKQMVEFTGSYHPLEIERLQGHLAELDELYNKTIEQHKERHEVVIREAQESRELAVGGFDEAYQNTLEELSISQGLGHKYGRPKRTLTARARDEFAQSRKRAQEVDGVLDELQADPTRLDLMVDLRAKMLARAQYLECLAEEYEVPEELPAVQVDLDAEVAEEPEEAPKKGKAKKKAKPKAKAKPKKGKAKSVAEEERPCFLPLIMAEVERCKTDMKALIGDRDVPEAILEHCETEQHHAEERRLEDIEVFRAQVERLSAWMHEQPQVVFAAVAEAVQQDAMQRAEELHTEFAAGLRKLEAKAEALRNRLRPGAGDMNEATLNKLDADEKERHDATVQLLSEYDTKMEALLEERRCTFARRLRNACTALVQLHDSMLHEPDLIPPPGGRPASKHKNLKHLIRAQSRDAEHVQNARWRRVGVDLQLEEEASLVGRRTAENRSTIKSRTQQLDEFRGWHEDDSEQKREEVRQLQEVEAKRMKAWETLAGYVRRDL